MKFFLTPIIKILLHFHTFIGKTIDVLAIKENNGIHPKHDIMRYYEFFLDHIRPEDTVLDIGCGNGFVASKIAEKAAKVTGIDTDKKNIRFSRKLCHTKKNVDFVLGDATTYRFKEQYTTIVLSNVLEHIRHRVDFLKKIQKISPKILIRVPMINRDWLPLYRKKLGMFYFCDSTHFTEYTIESFQKEIHKSGLVIDSHTVQFGEIWAVIKKV